MSHLNLAILKRTNKIKDTIFKNVFNLTCNVSNRDIAKPVNPSTDVKSTKESNNQFCNMWSNQLIKTSIHLKDFKK